MKKLSVGAIAAVVAALLIPLIPSSVGFAATSRDYASPVDLGDGVPAFTEQTLLNKGAKSECLSKIKQVRQDALQDSRVKIEKFGVKKTVRQYLADNGISESAYLNPHWSRKMEELAIARVVESSIHGLIAHQRVVDSSIRTLHVGDAYTGYENLAWGVGSCGYAIDMWASEKRSLVENINWETGHYLTLIDPNVTQIGIAGMGGDGATNMYYPYVWAMEATIGEQLDDSSAVDRSGVFVFPVHLPLDQVSEGLEFDSANLVSGSSYHLKGTLRAFNGKTFLRGTWVSDDEGVVQPMPDGSVLAKSVGSTKLHLQVPGVELTNNTVSVVVSPDSLGESISADAEGVLVRTVAEMPNHWVFRDVDSSRLFAGEIQWMKDERYSTGWPDHTYRPLNSVNRDAMAAFMYRLAGSPDVDLSGDGFSDVSRGRQFFKEIAWMKQSGISKGWFDNTFRPLEPVSREAMAAFLYRFCDKMPDKCAAALRPGSLAVPSGVKFRDVPGSHQFAEPIGWLAAAKISTGWNDGTFRPGEPIRRDAMAAFLYRLKNNYLVH